MKKKKTIRQIVREEVAMAIKEVITELKKPVKVEKPMTPKKRTQNSSFTSNKVSNSTFTNCSGILNFSTTTGAFNRVIRNSASVRNLTIASLVYSASLSIKEPLEVSSGFFIPTSLAAFSLALIKSLFKPIVIFHFSF